MTKLMTLEEGVQLFWETRLTSFLLIQKKVEEDYGEGYSHRSTPTCDYVREGT